MDLKEYYTILYTILIGLTILLYLKKGGELIQIRQHAIYVSVPILWSCAFIILLLKTYRAIITTNTNPYMIWVAIGSTACYYWIGMLLFPSTQQIDPQNQFVYFDYYEHFRKQHQWIMGLALLAFLFVFFISLNKAYSYSDYIMIGLFGLAFFTEHKGLMCLLSWGMLSLLIFEIL
ncbi:MAG: Unknown protein [uncultured Aureispira sp.]|uniref:Uncharacterized protein n=1 Tax=uncultured Aureispira sp. TaxID=1331704 RepID=A0A6S6TBY5_9BACT|nr:MAG: Unknown protein [uncultured Aureispira sp.]